MKSETMPITAIGTTGLATVIAQIIVLRELLVLFYGNELASGVVLAGWLMWTALGAWFAGKKSAGDSWQSLVFGILFPFLAVIQPLLILFIRGARLIWAIPYGELPGFGQMLFISLVVPGIICPVFGALFTVCWAAYRSHRLKESAIPLPVYMAESIGAALGGLIFYHAFFPVFSVYEAALATSAVVLAVSGWAVRPWKSGHGNRISRLVWWLALVTVLSFAFFSGRIESASRKLQWGRNVAAVSDTAYHNVAISRNGGQTSVFSNGIWLFSEPDRRTAEYSIHPALLQHPAPETVLLLGGGVSGIVGEIFKHPRIRRVDYVEQDPDFIPFVKKYLSSETQKHLGKEKLRIIHQDPAVFLRLARNRYDAILLNSGDPVNAQMNRYYTVGFFEAVKSRLTDHGVFSFAVSGGESMLGPAQARFLGSIHNTMTRVFTDILILPGDHTRFFAASKPGRLATDYRILSDRKNNRKIDTVFIREDTLADAFNTLRLDYMKSVLAQYPDAPVNRDFKPVCYFHNMMLWAAQWHPALLKTLEKMAAVTLFEFWTGAGILGIVIAAFFMVRPRFKTAVCGCVAIEGAAGMTILLVLLLGFQIIQGFVYLQLARIIAFFMAGLGIGAGITAWKKHRHKTENRSRAGFIRIQAVTVIFPAVLVLFLEVIRGDFSPALAGWLFSGMSLISGIIGGSHFSLAVIAVAGSGPNLYALDLAGSAAGALLTGLFLLPVFGITNSLVFLCVVSVVGLVTILCGVKPNSG